MELKDCPFCGGKAYRVSGGDDEKPIEYVMCTSCHAMTGKVPTAEEAAERWNLREERTCRIVEDVDEAETELGPIEVRTYLCGECHERMAPDDAYCPNCGAKVVDE